jgi:hypothetical protein
LNSALRTQISELHYIFKGYVSCMYVVILTFILLTAHDQVALINLLSIYFQTTPATSRPPLATSPRHPQPQQENKVNTNGRKSAETVVTSFNKRQLTTNDSCCRIKKNFFLKFCYCYDTKNSSSVHWRSATKVRKFVSGIQLVLYSYTECGKQD